MVLKLRLNPLPKVPVEDRRMLAVVDLALVRDAADIDRVRQDLVEVAAAERTPAGQAACAIGAGRKPDPLVLQALPQQDHALSLEIAKKEIAHDPGVVVDNVKGA